MPLRDLLGNSVPFLLYFPAIVIAGWFGGTGPGLLATLLSGYCAKTWFFEPVGTFELADAGSVFRLALFLASGGLISFLCGRLHQRTAELELEKLRLEASVKQRTSHLERALADMEAFSYTVSHDLRAPMRTVEGFSAVLLEDHAAGLNPEAKSHLERIRNAARRSEQMTNDLLALAKISGTTVVTRPIALRHAVAQFVEHSPRWTSGEVEIDFSGCVHTALAHETLLQQILQNLLENAVKFVGRDVKPAIRISSEARDGHVRLWIADNGIGIAPADQHRIFNIFERSNGAAAGYAGTGIGLAIVERAAAKMNGRVGVESAVGAGSRFWVELERVEGGDSS